MLHRGGRKRKMSSERLPSALPVAPLLRPAAFRMPCGDDRIGFPDGARLVSGPFQPFVGDLRPELLQGCGRCLVRMSFGVVRCPGHLLVVGGRRRFIRLGLRSSVKNGWFLNRAQLFGLARRATASYLPGRRRILRTIRGDRLMAAITATPSLTSHRGCDFIRSDAT